MSIYVVAGATGHVGAVVARALLARHIEVRAIVRSEEKGAELKGLGAELRIGSLEDSAFLTEVLTGADGAFLMIPPIPAANDFRAAQQIVLDAEVQAVTASKVPHVVFLSSWGADLDAGTGPILALHKAEQALPQTGARLTLVRAGMFAENLTHMIPVARDQGILPNFLRVDLSLPLIASHDIAHVVVDALVTPPAQDEVVYVVGPHEYTPADQAAVLEKYLSRSVQLVNIGPEAAAGTLRHSGFKPSLADLYAEMYAALNAGLLTIVEGHRVVTGRQSLEDVMEPYCRYAR